MSYNLYIFRNFSCYFCSKELLRFLEKYFHFCLSWNFRVVADMHMGSVILKLWGNFGFFSREHVLFPDQAAIAKALSNHALSYSSNMYESCEGTVNFNLAEELILMHLPSCDYWSSRSKCRMRKTSR